MPYGLVLCHFHIRLSGLSFAICAVSCDQLLLQSRVRHQCYLLAVSTDYLRGSCRHSFEWLIVAVAACCIICLPCIGGHSNLGAASNNDPWSVCLVFHIVQEYASLFTGQIQDRQATLY